MNTFIIFTILSNLGFSNVSICTFLRFFRILLRFGHLKSTNNPFYYFFLFHRNLIVSNERLGTLLLIDLFYHILDISTGRICTFLLFFHFNIFSIFIFFLMEIEFSKVTLRTFLLFFSF